MTWDNRVTIAAAIAGLVVAASVVTFSPFRHARMPHPDEEDSARA